MVRKRLTNATDNKIFDDVVVGLGSTALGSATPRSFIKENRIPDLRMIQFTDLDTLFLPLVVVQLQDLQQMDSFYKNQIHQLDLQILKFKHILDQDL